MVLGTRQVIERALNNQVADKELSLVQVVAEDIANPLLDGDVLVVQRMLEAVVRMNPNNIYAFVTGLPSGMVIHTFPKGFPAGLININPVPPGERSSMRILDSEQGLIRDVGYKILDGLDAELHIGFSQQEVRQATGKLARTVILLTIIGMLTALVVASFLSRRILKPLEKLTLSLRRLGEGYLGETIKVAGNDELGELAVCFNEMSSRLKESIDGLRTSEANYRLLH